ncbi:unnamed protein product [Protopolystoma xenopodis]|uniref:Uncharacterized protein n=1 Tax=Protopolystoma xenopodis TaxID=117903 RepID=A0A448WW52_9PLAT|nr:unnamed protein product [Protopolystoma xenopodis]
MLRRRATSPLFALRVNDGPLDISGHQVPGPIFPMAKAANHLVMLLCDLLDMNRGECSYPTYIVISIFVFLLKINR